MSGGAGRIPALPGAEPFDDELQQRLASAFGARGDDFAAHHRARDLPRFTNRLVLETSPYLRQHAHNPVDWYPWGDEAFARAAAGGRPVFLSIGYSTCHWCHVMEQESFEDVEIAAFLNRHYVAIKVDREERPDVDAVYMTAVQALTGHGGWPMSVWLDAERRPFFAGTYFPARDGDRGAARGFLALLDDLQAVYHTDRARVGEAAESIADAVRRILGAGVHPDESAGAQPDASVLAEAMQHYERAYDPTYGGVRGAPKFPSSLPVRVLLREHRRTGDPAPLVMAERTLEMMAAGGMHDQLGGGFHRYSTDERWLVPHFEKMLYDNALLALAYVEAWQVTKRPEFARIVRMTLDYISREMTSPEGAFYSATDADSEGGEGTFFLWSEPEIRELLGPRSGQLVSYYGVTARGNFERKNVLFVPRPDEREWEALAPEREVLRQAREGRPHPLRDDKMLAAWNGLMISAFATAGRILGERRYVRAAVQAADWLLRVMRPGGRLQRSWKDGRSSGPGFLEDDAFLTASLLDLYEATFHPRWLTEALAMADGTERLFGDDERGGWFRAADDHETLIAREKPSHDGAEPSGASVATLNALRLQTMTGDDRWREIALRALGAYATTLRQQPAALHDMLLAVDYAAGRAPEIVVVWPRGEREAAEPLLEVLRDTFVPNRALLGAEEGDGVDRLAALAPLVTGKSLLDGRAAAYVCERGTCQLPVTTPAALRASLRAPSAG